MQFYDTDDQGTQNAIGDLWVPLTDLKQGVELVWTLCQRSQGGKWFLGVIMLALCSIHLFSPHVDVET